MQLVVKDGFRQAVAEIEREKILCDWITFDLQSELFIIEDAEGLVSQAFSETSPFIGNSFTAFCQGDFVLIGKTPLNRTDKIAFSKYAIDEIKLALFKWKEFVSQ